MYLLARSFTFFIILFSTSFTFSSCSKFKRKPNYEVVLETDMRDVLFKLAGMNSQKDYFISALSKADVQYHSKLNSNYLDIFIPLLQKENAAPLADIFYSLKTTGDSDAEIIKAIKEHFNIGMERELTVIKNRLEENDIKVFSVQRIGFNLIVVKVYTEDPSMVSNLISANAELYFYEILPGHEANQIISRMELAIQNNDTLKKLFTDIDGEEARAKLYVQEDGSDTQKDSSLNVPSVLISGLLYELKYEQAIVYKISDTAQVNRIISHPVISQLIPKKVSLYWQNNSRGELLELVPVYNQYNSFDRWIGGDVISAASPTTIGNKSNLAISLEMNEEGTRKFKIITARLASTPERGRIAVVMNNQCLTAPRVQSEIPNGKAVITGNFTVSEAKFMCSLINAGALPFRCKVVEVKVIKD